MAKHAGSSVWKERSDAAAVSRIGGQRSWIWAVVNLSTTIMGAPQLGLSQRGHACSREGCFRFGVRSR